MGWGVHIAFLDSEKFCPCLDPKDSKETLWIRTYNHMPILKQNKKKQVWQRGGVGGYALLSQHCPFLFVTSLP